MLDLPLQHLLRPAIADNGVPRLLVLLHGVGSNESDLFGLASQVPPQFNVLSLRGPVTLGPGSYAWFAVQFTASGSVINEAQETLSRAQLGEVIASAARQLGVAPGQVVVGGFSQGGIMSLSLLLTRPELLQAAMVMHSRLLPQIAPHRAPLAALKGKFLWLSHGLQDQVLGVAGARAIRDQAHDWPLTLSYHEFPGGHELRPAELDQAMRWLAALP